MEHSELLDRVAHLLDGFAGTGEGKGLLDRLLVSMHSPEAIVRDVARSPAFERLYKRNRTIDVMHEGRIEADPAFVGIPELDQGMPFEYQFHHWLRPRLGKRARGFEVLFDALLARPPGTAIVETGCLRIPGNLGG